MAIENVNQQADTLRRRGVRYKRGTHHDEYSGTAAALIDAGVVRLDQLPGQSGRGKVCCSYLADGSPAVKGDSNSPHTEAGYVRILKRGERYAVSVRLPDHLVRSPWRNEPAHEVRDVPHVRGHLKLVWSAPVQRVQRGAI